MPAYSGVYERIRHNPCTGHARRLVQLHAVPRPAPRRESGLTLRTGTRMQAQQQRILIVEDEPTIRNLLSEVLADAGHAVHAAAGGREALARLKDTTIDLVVLDLQMPALNGLEVCQRIRQAERQAGTGARRTIIVVTALPDPHVRDACADAGADEYLAKPFELDELLARLDPSSLS